MRNATAQPSTAYGIFGPPLGQLRSKSGWFVALGIALLVFGTVALGALHAETGDVGNVLGTLMIVGAVTQILVAFSVRACGGFQYWLCSGLFYGGAGAFAFYNPQLAVTSLNLLLAASLIVSAALRIWLGTEARALNGVGWLIASGIVSCLAAVLIALGWPADAQGRLGLWLAIDLTFQGVAVLAFALQLNRAVKGG